MQELVPSSSARTRASASRAADPVDRRAREAADRATSAARRPTSPSSATPGSRSSRRSARSSRSTRRRRRLDGAIPRRSSSPASGTPTSSTARPTACPGTWTRACSSTAPTSSRAPATTDARRPGPSGATAMAGDQARASAPDRYAIFLPINEWAQPVILGLQAGSPLLRDDATRGAFSRARVPRAPSTFYLDLFRDGLAPPVGNNEIANLYQEFARGYFAMYITGPWNLGEFRAAAAARAAGRWATAPLARPDGAAPRRVARRRLEPRRCSARSRAQGGGLAARRVPLASPQQQVRFYELTGDLPGARRGVGRTGARARRRRTRAFRDAARARARRRRKVPEWEQIATRAARTRPSARCAARVPPDSALAALDATSTGCSRSGAGCWSARCASEARADERVAIERAAGARRLALRRAGARR